jgi:hypothetical protein
MHHTAHNRHCRNEPIHCTVLEDHSAGAHEPCAMGIRVRWLRPVLPAETRGRAHRTHLLHERGLPFARSPNLSLQRLRSPPPACLGLHRADTTDDQRLPLASRNLQLPSAGRRKGAAGLAPSGVQRPRCGTSRRDIVRRTHDQRRRGARGRLGGSHHLPHRLMLSCLPIPLDPLDPVL